MATGAKQSRPCTPHDNGGPVPAGEGAKLWIKDGQLTKVDLPIDSVHSSKDFLRILMLLLAMVLPTRKLIHKWPYLLYDLLVL
jgi:hypothetical protein